MKITGKWFCILFLSFLTNVHFQTVRINAATFSITNLNDGGAGSLRQVITDANATAGADTIEFQSGAVGTINLLSALPDLSSDIVINGRSADSSIVRRSATDGFRIFNVTAGATVVVNNLTLQNGSAPAPFNGGEYNVARGGAILNNGNLTVRSCKILDNLAGGAISYGGGIYNQSGVITIEKTLFSNNRATYGGCEICHADGGTICNAGGGTMIIDETSISNSSGSAAIFNQGIINISDSKITNNGKGGIYSANRLNLIRSTVANNTPYGILLSTFYMPIGTAAIENSTVSGNTNVGYPFSSYTGGIIQISTSNLQISNSTITGNQGGGLYIGGCQMPCKIINTIIAGNTSTNTTLDFISNSVNYTGFYNLIGNGSGYRFTNGTDGNIVGTADAPVNPQLSPLGDYGGKTPTHKLLSSSPAINRAHPTDFSPTDQRGVARPVGSRADIGAFEFNLTPHRALPKGGLNADYNQSLAAFADRPDAAFSFAVSAGALPPGLSLVRQSDATAAIVGVPRATGTYNFTITASGADGFTISADYTLIVRNSVSFVGVCGRVFSAQRRGDGRAFVFIFDSNGNLVRQTPTNPFGFFRFNDVQAEENYTFTVVSKTRRFAPQIVAVNDGSDCLNFTAEP